MAEPPRRRSEKKDVDESLPLAGRFAALRDQHGREMAEDYTELVLGLIEVEGEARVGRIAAAYGVSHVTALRTLQRLEKEGFVELARHQPVTLTSEGRRLALWARRRHRVVRDFLLCLGVPRGVAEVDSEGAEHHMSAVTIRRMEYFMRPKRREGQRRNSQP